MIGAAGFLPWMAAAIALGICAAALAWSIEQLSTLWRGARALPKRLLWGAALSIATAGPAALPMFRRAAPMPPAAQIDVPFVSSDAVSSSPNGTGAPQVVMLLWLVASFLLAVRLSRSVWRVHQVRQTAERTIVHGTPVLLTDVTGPASVGVLRPEVVLPRWVLSLDPSLRDLILAHETAHGRARDVAWLWLAALATVLVPWNPSVWWLARRLRLAVECDCDTRTLRAVQDVPLVRERYARLLLLMAQRAHTPAWGLALAHPSSHLTRRITTMLHPIPLNPRRTAALAVATAIFAVVGACSPGVTDSLSGPPEESTQPAATTTVDVDPPFYEFQVDEPANAVSGSVGPSYPADLRAARVTGVVLAQFVVDAEGRVELGTLKVVQSDHDGFSAAVEEALPAMRFEAARKDGQSVRQLVQQPFAFNIAP